MTSLIDPTQRPKRTKFQDALLKERARLQMSRNDVARRVGIDVGTIKRWEDGEAIPSVQQFKRLVGTLRRIAPYPPEWGSFSPKETLFGGRDQYVEDVKEILKRSPEEDLPRPPPQSFGQGLLRIRQENEITQESLGEIVGVAGATVGFWERDEATPVQENFDKLLQILPELEASIAVGAVRRPEPRDIPKPLGPTGWKFPERGSPSQAVDIVMQDSDKERNKPHEHLTPRFTHRDFTHHEHSFIDETMPPWVEGGRATGRRVCSVCGIPQQSQIAAPKDDQHQDVVRRRCPKCGGSCHNTPHSEKKPWVCARCRSLLEDLDLLDDDAGDTVARGKPSVVAELAEAYARARLEVVRKKVALDKANEAWVNATTDFKNSEQEVTETLQLLDLAVQEEADKGGK